MIDTPFDRIGLSSKDDFKSIYWKEIFSRLESKSKEFLLHESEFRSPEYLRLWSRDPLHNWSRMWEYPYVYHHLQKFHQENPETMKPVVVDIGSGVTFFPLSVADLGFQVIAVDNDPVVENDLLKACSILKIPQSIISVKKGSALSLPFPDHSVDSAYCISVLEHIPNPEKVIREVCRVLKPNGLFILTIDIDLKGNSECKPDAFKLIVEELERYFLPMVPDKTIHPLKINDSFTEPYPQHRRRGIIRNTLSLSKALLLSAFGKGKFSLKVNWLACYGFVGNSRYS